MRIYKKISQTTAALITITLLGGCAGADHEFDFDGAYDPLDGWNRVVYKFNKGVDYVALRPFALVYDKVAPQPVKTAVGNVLDNLGEPRNMVNHLLQKRGEEMFVSGARFAINTTAGVGGIFDVARLMDLRESQNDFGITFRAYTTNDGMVLMLPFLGPSSITDLPGLAAEWYLDPLRLADVDEEIQYGVTAAQLIHTRASLLKQEDLLDTALDEYEFVRDFREEYRRQQVPPPEELWFHHSDIGGDR